MFGAQLSLNFDLGIFFREIFATLRFGKYKKRKKSTKNEKHSFVSHTLLHKYSVFLSLTSFPWLLVSQNIVFQINLFFFSFVDINFSFSILFRNSNNNKNTQSLSCFFCQNNMRKWKFSLFLWLASFCFLSQCFGLCCSLNDEGKCFFYSLRKFLFFSC